MNTSTGFVFVPLTLFFSYIYILHHVICQTYSVMLPFNTPVRLRQVSAKGTVDPQPLRTLHPGRPDPNTQIPPPGSPSLHAGFVPTGAYRICRIRLEAADRGRGSNTADEYWGRAACLA
jgi:hypothetical protein